jgi:hypothetical protein
MGKLAFAGCLLGLLILTGGYARSLNEPETAVPPCPTPCGIESCISKVCKGNYRTCATKGSCPHRSLRCAALARAVALSVANQRR